MATGKFVAYYRVSTAKQGASGLGLEAQKEAVSRYLNGGAWSLVAEFTEIESGKKNKRPALAAALAACHLHGATLVVAKLDRLSRNVAFVSALMESGVEFVAVDFPMANKLTVHILAAVAEHEAAMISARTKSALAAAKARGVRLGTRNPENIRNVQQIGALASAEARIENANKRARYVVPTIRELAAAGRSLNAIAAELNSRSIPTPRRTGAWTATAVKRALARVAEAA